MLVLVLAGGSGCGRETALSVPGGAGGEPGRSPGGVTDGSDGGAIDSRDAAPLDTSLISGAPDASAAPDSSAAKPQSVAWTNHTQGTLASGQEWLAVASDASGEHLVATSSTRFPPGGLVGGFWTSSDGGSTWTNRGGNDIGSVASNSTGTVLIGGGGCNGGAGLWELTNSGATWTVMRASPGGISVASDATGTHLVAGGGGLRSGSTNGDIWTSSNSGASWTDQTASGPAHDQAWTSIASSSSGTKLVALSGYCGAPNGDIWTSTDSGATWINRTLTAPVHEARLISVASDSSGMNLVAVGSSIWTSADAGLTWTRQIAPSDTSDSDVWVSVASDATGKHLIAATFGDPGTGGSAGGGGGFRPERAGNIFISTNAGVDWTNETAGTAAADQDWVGVASDSLGVHFVAIASFGDIWTN